MSANKPSAILPLAALALAFALRGGRESFAFAAVFVLLSALPFLKDFRDQLQVRARVFLPFLLLLLWCLLGTFQDPLARHFYRFAQLLMYFFVAVAAADWGDTSRKRFLLAVASISVIDALVFIVRYAGDPAATGYLIGNPSYSGLLWASGFLALLVLSRELTNRNRLAAALAGLLLLVGLFLLRSRSSLVGLLVALVFVLPRRRFFAVLSAAATAILFLAISDGDRLLAYVKIDPTQPHEWLGRLQIWKTALLAIVDRPLFGWGLGNFEAAYLRHQLPVADALRYERSTPFAHNDFLQIAAEAGLPALAAFLWGLVSFFRYSRSDDAPTGAWSRAVVTLFAVSALFNFAILLPLCGMISAVALGFGFSRRESKPLAGRWLIWTSATVASFLGLFLVLNGAADVFLKKGNADLAVRLMPLRPDLWYASAMNRLQRQDWMGKPDLEADVFRRLSATVDANPEDAFAWNRMGVVAMSVMNPPVNARDAFARALELAPKHAPFWVDAGFERVGQNDRAEAERLFKQAAELEPNAPIPRFALAVAAARTGDARSANQRLEEAVAIHRAFAGRVSESGYSAYLFGLDEVAMQRRVAVVLERAKRD